LIPTTASVVPAARRWAAGNRAAGNELVVSHDPWIRHHARREAMRWESVEDIAQEMRVAFVHASTHVDESAPDVETIAYLRRAMRRAVAALRRHIESTDGPGAEEMNWKSRRSRLVNDDGGDAGVDTDVQSCPAIQDDVLELRQVIDGARITSAQLDAVVARYVLGDSEAEAANRCGVSPFVARRNTIAGLVAMREFAGVTEEAPRARAVTPYRETETRIADLLKREGALTGEQIRAALGIGLKSFWKVTSGMRERGVMRTEGSNKSMRYMLSDGAPKVEAA
jgi:DNA-directed RNA polymerase specialized sigma24 family protein